MKRIIAACLLPLLFVFVAIGQTPSFKSFNTPSQFATNGLMISIKSGALQTNIDFYGITDVHSNLNQDGITSLVTISSTNTSIGQNGDNYGIIGAGRFRVLGIRDGTAPLIYFANSGGSGAGISYTNNGLFGGGMGLTFNNDWRLHVSSIRVAVTNALFVPIGGIEAVGSQNDMLSTFTGNSQWHLNGSAAGRAATGDSIFTVYNWSTNANNSGAGIGVVVMGQDASGNPIVLDAVGSSFNHVPTNRPAGLIPGWSQLVFNSSAAHMKGLAISSPGTAWGKPDNGNYSLAMFDFPNQMFRVPLEVSGVYQPSQAGWRDAMTVNQDTGLTTVTNFTVTGAAVFQNPNQGTSVATVGLDSTGKITTNGVSGGNATNVVNNPLTLAATSQATNYTVNLMPGPSGNLITIYTANTNAFITFTGTNIADTSRTVLFRAWTNSIVVKVEFSSGVRTNYNFNPFVTNGFSKILNFYNADTTGTNILVSDAGRYQ